MTSRNICPNPVLVAIVPALLVAFVLLLPGCGDPSEAINTTTFTVQRGKLTVSVTEGGGLEAVKSVNIASEVEGQSRILSIVPEGSFAKKDDILVELDSVDLQDRITGQEITFQNATSSYAQATSTYDIQLNQNQSNINAAELKVKFAEMDLFKYLGDSLGAGALADTARETVVETAELGDAVSPDAVSLSPYSGEDLRALVEMKDLSGEANQRHIKLKSDIELAIEEYKRAETRVVSTTKLYEKQFVTMTELDADKLAVKRADYAREHARVALSIFKEYEFPRQVEQLVSDYHEAERELERVRAKADSEVAKAKANLTAAEQTLQLQTSKLDKLRDQLKKTSITAPQDGMVVYASSTQQSRRGSSGVLIEAGATVRYQQDIISLPDTSSMKVVVNVHEASIEKVKQGMPAVIVVDAFPENLVPGRVTKVAVLADSAMGWLNPDLKTYRTDVTLDRVWEGLKPGMSAQVEIVIAELDSVLSVPIQAVVIRGGSTVCFLLNGDEPLETPVEIGQSGESFVEIRSGLKVGDVVLLAPPPAPPEEEDQKTGAEEPPAETPGPPVQNVAPGQVPSPATGEPAADASPRGRGERPEGGEGAEPGRRRPGGGRGMGMDPEALAEAAKTMTPEQKKQMLERIKDLPEEQRTRIEKILNDAGIKE